MSNSSTDGFITGSKTSIADMQINQTVQGVQFVFTNGTSDKTANDIKAITSSCSAEVVITSDVSDPSIAIAPGGSFTVTCDVTPQKVGPINAYIVLSYTSESLVSPGIAIASAYGTVIEAT